MGKYIILSKSIDNSIRYISNISPLLWTDNKNNAKVFGSEAEMLTDLSYHKESLNKMKEALNLEFKVEMVE